MCCWSWQRKVYIYIQISSYIYRVGQNHIYTVYIRIFGSEFTKYTVIYGENIRFWPTLYIIYHMHSHVHAALKTCRPASLRLHLRVQQTRVLSYPQSRSTKAMLAWKGYKGEYEGNTWLKRLQRAMSTGGTRERSVIKGFGMWHTCKTRHREPKVYSAAIG